MPTVRLGFCAFPSFWGRLIDWGTQGEVGHAFAVLPSGEILDSQHDAGLGGKPSGVQIRPAGYLAKAKAKNILYVDFPCSKIQRDAFYAFLHAQVGKPYDTQGIIGYFFGKPWRDPGAWYCSELDGAAAEAAKFFPAPLRTPHDRLTPEEWLLIVSAFAPVKAG
jgi:hypothetical protein